MTVIGCLIILASVPPVSRDALTHHLAVPKIYLEKGHIHEIPELVFSYYPMNLDLIYMLPLYFGNDIVPKYIHMLFGLMTAGLIYHYLSQRLSRLYALVGFLFFLSLPVIVKLSSTAYVDLGLVFFSTVAILLLFKWKNSHFQKRFLVCAAAFCGLAMGTKYNGLIVFLILSLLVPWIYARSAGRTENRLSAPLGWGVLFFLVALVVFSPWMIRNTIWTGNPVYPLYNSIFLAETANGSLALSTHMPPFVLRKTVYGESLIDILMIPLRIFFQGADDNPRFFDGELNPYLLLLPFSILVARIKRASSIKDEMLILSFFAALCLGLTFFFHDMRIRYIAPIIPPMVILAVIGLHDLHKIINGMAGRLQLGRWCANTTMVLLILPAFMVNGMYCLQQFDKVDPFSFLSGNVSREAYIARYYPEFTVVQYANRNIQKEALILGVGLGNRRYYFDRKVVFDLMYFKKALMQSKPAAQIAKELQAKGFTHILISELLHQTVLADMEGSRPVIDELFSNHAKLLISHQQYALYEIVG